MPFHLPFLRPRSGATPGSLAAAQSLEPADENAPRLPRESVNDAIASYDVIIDANLTRLAAAVKPVIEGQIEFTKSMTTLSTWALLLSTSLSQFAIPRLTHPRLLVLLPLAFADFGAIVVLAALRVKWVQDAQLGPVIIEGARADLDTAIRSLPTERELARSVDEKVAPAYDQAFAVAMRNHKRLSRSQAVCSGLLAAGLVALTIFASVNLPW